MNPIRNALFVTILFLLTSPLFATAKIQVEELDYLGPPAENWLVAGMRSTVTNDLRRVAGSHDFEVVTVEDQNEALKVAGEKRKAGAKIDLSAEAAKILAVDYRCVGSVQNLDKVVRVTLRLLKAPDYKVWKSTTTDKNRSELLDLQNVVVYNLLNDIDGKLTKEDKKIIEIAKPKSLTAYELYAQGLKVKDTNPKQALLFYEQAIELDENYVDALSAAGYTAGVTLNLFSKAEKYLLRAEKVLRARGETNTWQYSNVLFTLGQVKKVKGELDKALEFYFKSKAIDDKRGEQNTSGYAQLMTCIGNAFSDTDKALEFYLKSKSIQDNLGLQNTNNYGMLMNNMGGTYQSKGDLDKALEFYLKSKLIRDKLGLQNTNSYANLMTNMGITYKAMGDLDKALEFYLKDKAIEDNLGLQNTNSYANLLYNLAILYKSLGNTVEASKNYRKASEIYSKLGFQKDADIASGKAKEMEAE